MPNPAPNSPYVSRKDVRSSITVTKIQQNSKFSIQNKKRGLTLFFVACTDAKPSAAWCLHQLCRGATEEFFWGGVRDLRVLGVLGILVSFPRFPRFPRFSTFSLSLPSLHTGYRRVPLGLDRLRLGNADVLGKKSYGISTTQGSAATKSPFSKGDLGGLSIFLF